MGGADPHYQLQYMHLLYIYICSALLVKQAIVLNFT